MVTAEACHNPDYSLDHIEQEYSKWVQAVADKQVVDRSSKAADTEVNSYRQEEQLDPKEQEVVSLVVEEVGQLEKAEHIVTESLVLREKN